MVDPSLWAEALNHDDLDEKDRKRINNIKDLAPQVLSTFLLTVQAQRDTYQKQRTT